MRIPFLLAHRLRAFPAPLFLCLVAWVVMPAAPAPRPTRGPYLQDAGPTSVVVRWRTGLSGQGQVEYREEEEGRPRVAYSGFGPDHRARLIGLEAGRSYRYRLFAGDAPVGEEYRLAAAKPPGAPFRFLVFGDSGTGSKAQYTLAERMAAEAADFAIHTGDVVYPFGEDQHYDRKCFRPYASMLRRMVLWPCLGNHDIVAGEQSAYFRIFDLPANGPAGVKPGRNYSFDYGSARFVALDSNSSPAVLKERVAPWLERMMAAAPQPTWRFVFFHHPPYSDGLHGGSDTIRRTVVPALERARVDVVFNGHDHDYQRNHPIRGVTYVVSGGGGAGLYPRRHRSRRTAKFYNRRHGFVVADLSGDTLALRYLNGRGETVDSHTVKR